jgi:hypothetical protein
MVRTQIIDHVHVFPDPDNPALIPFTRAFVRMMFAHAEFDRRFSDLLGAITVDWDFGARPENIWSATSRPKRIRKLIKEHESKHVGGIVERDDIADCLTRAIEPCKSRNTLAHGHWWAFDLKANVISVRASANWPGEWPHRNFSEADIQEIADKLDDLEVELYKLQTSITVRSPPRFLKHL